MITKSINDVSEQDLQKLITDAVPEWKVIEYKSVLPGGSDAEKKEFLADVSSFANTSGGDLVYGMDEEQRIPKSLPGLTINDADLQLGRLDNMIRDGIKPRLKHTIKAVDLSGGKKAVVIRIERSWLKPHRVVFQGHDKFYARTSAGKYPLDVDELRSAFTTSQGTIERLRDFRAGRIIALSNDETPIPFVAGGKIVLHFIPLDAFSSTTTYDVLQYNQRPQLMPPMRDLGGWRHRITLEGVLTHSGNPTAISYTHLFRTGLIEAVEGTYLNQEQNRKRTLPSIRYEEVIINYVPKCFEILRTLAVNLPIVLALTLTNVRGVEMSRDSLDTDEYYPISANTLALPETMIESLDQPPQAVLRPMFDLIWNACGQPRSKNFDADGNWRPIRQ